MKLDPRAVADASARHAASLVAIAFLAGCVAGSNGAGSSADSPEVKVDALFAEWNTQTSPGCGVGVMQNGASVFERGYGMANLEQSVPITPATIFDPASIAKPFTALAVMLLAEEGALSLDDEVWRHLPEWANRTDPVTIRDLVAHTGGQSRQLHAAYPGTETDRPGAVR
jgi:CubicO group peptidase (beta-lactamase class C family)